VSDIYICLVFTSGFMLSPSRAYGVTKENIYTIADVSARGINARKRPS